MAEHLLKAALKHRGLHGRFTVSSAGTSAMAGVGATDEAIDVMARDGHSLHEHRASPLDDAVIDRAWLILTMTRGHKEDVLSRFPQALERVYTLGEFAGTPYGTEWEVPDPFGRGVGEYQRVQKELHKVVEQIADRLAEREILDERGATRMKVAFGCDHAGIDLREAVVAVVDELGHTLLDFGTHSKESVDYPDFGAKVATAVAKGEADLGIVVCGTGIGISIAANKVKGIRAALCSETYSARMSREHNDANVLAMGARVIGPDLAKEIVRTFLTTSFGGDRHRRRVDKISALEES